MAETDFLKLYKKDPVLNRNDTFNITTMLNDNWDKLDTTLFNLNKDKVDKITGKGLSTNDFTTTLKNKLDGIDVGANKYIHPDNHSLDIITETATKKIMTDLERIEIAKVKDKVDKVAGKGLSKNDYTDLEKAEVGKIKKLATLHELALLEDEVRTHKADEAVHGIGDKTALKTTHKASIVGAVNELFTNVSNGKSAIATAITGKGVVTSGSDTFAKMAGNIKDIKVGDYSVGDRIPGMKIEKPEIRSLYKHRANIIPRPMGVTGRGSYAYYSSGTVLIKVDAYNNNSEIWRLTFPTPFNSNSIACDDEGGLFIYHSGEMIKKDPSNGSDIWSSKDPSFTYLNTVVNRVLFDKDFVYVVTGMKTMTKFKKDDGSVVWSNTYSVNLSFPTMDKGYIYFVQLGLLYSIDTSTGTLKSIVGINDLQSSGGGVVVANKIYAQSLTGGTTKMKRFNMSGIVEKEASGFRAKSFFVLSPYGIWVSIDGAYANNLKLLDGDLNEVTRGYQFGDNSYDGDSGSFYGMDIDKDGNLFYLMGINSSYYFGGDSAKSYYNIL